MAIRMVRVDKPDDVDVIVGQAHFITSVEDLHEEVRQPWRSRCPWGARRTGPRPAGAHAPSAGASRLFGNRDHSYRGHSSGGPS
jgi:adenosine specific kinase